MSTFEIMENESQEAVIKVVGVGGCGGNAVEHMVSRGVSGVEFIAMNTDSQALKRSKASVLLQLGGELTRGLGAGANPEVGRQAALADRERITEMITGADMLFITAGMGGGTGTGAAPVVAQIARELGILTVAVVTKPFSFEGRRMKAALEGIEQLTQYVDSVIVIPNEKLMSVLGDDVGMLEAYQAANDVLQGAVAGISEVINCPGLVNVDFADVKAVMSNAGSALMGIGMATGENKAIEAAKQAVNSNLLDMSIDGARGIVFTITGGPDLSMTEVSDAAKVITSAADDDAKIIFGAVIDEKMKDQIKITVVATGFDGHGKSQKSEMTKSYTPNSFIVEKEIEKEPMSSTSVDKNKGKFNVFKNIPVKPALERKAERPTNEDDDLSVPAFIRKKMG